MELVQEWHLVDQQGETFWATGFDPAFWYVSDGRRIPRGEQDRVLASLDARSNELPHCVTSRYAYFLDIARKPDQNQGWISPTGELYFVLLGGHSTVAGLFWNVSERQLASQGWLHFSEVDGFLLLRGNLTEAQEQALSNRFPCLKRRHYRIQKVDPTWIVYTPPQVMTWEQYQQGRSK